MKSFRKTPHALFVEEESYNWAPSQHRSRRVMLMILVVSVLTGVLLISIGN